MKISIALTTYNGARFLPAQLESFLAQSRQPDELVVCDDGSRDETTEILREFCRRAPFVVRIFQNEKNLGYTQNFASAIQRADGDLIFLSDQDDRWHPEKLAEFEGRFAADADLIALFSDSALVDIELRPTGGTLFSASGFTDEEKKLVRAGEAWRVFFRHNVVAGNNLAFRAKYREQALPIPAGYVHDAWLVLTLAMLGKVDFLDRCFLDYRQHGNQNIGVLEGGPWEVLRARLRRAGRQGDERAIELKRWLEFEKWLGLHRPNFSRNEVEEKRIWLEGRAALRRFRPSRLSFMLRHAQAYRKFDNGWQTMVKDLLF